MRWSLARMLALTTSLALMFAIYSQYWKTADLNVQTVFRLCAYLAILSVASVLAFKAPPRWRNFWITYAVFGWSYLIFELRLGRIMDENVQFEFSPQIGIMAGFACAFMVLALSSPTKSEKDRDERTTEN